MVIIGYRSVGRGVTMPSATATDTEELWWVFTFMVPIGVVGIVIPSPWANRQAGAEVEGHMHKAPTHTHTHTMP